MLMNRLKNIQICYQQLTRQIPSGPIINTQVRNDETVITSPYPFLPRTKPQNRSAEINTDEPVLHPDSWRPVVAPHLAPRLAGEGKLPAEQSQTSPQSSQHCVRSAGVGGKKRTLGENKFTFCHEHYPPLGQASCADD